MAGEDHAHPAPAAGAPLLHPQIPRVEPADLAEVLLKAAGDASDTATPARPVIVDVRDVGTTGGFILGAVNLPKADFDDEAKVDALIEKIKDEPEIVFHCQHSQHRGPGAAFQFLERLERKLQEGETKPEVKVLRGGFHEFSQLYGDDEKLVDSNPLA